jgi:hypothetical protein
MRIGTWHVGKIVMLWAWGAATIIVVLHVLKEYEAGLKEHVLVGFSLLSLLLIIPMSLSVLTWRWFSGKEVGANASTARARSNQSRVIEPGEGEQ